MTVQGYLYNRASAAVLSDDEKAQIANSIETIKKRMNAYFEGGLLSHFVFGSHTRGTILPRTMDPQSDVDYMVVFRDSGYTPQAYLDRLKRFAEKYYYSSEIYQSSPTMVLDLNHIRFELVPALDDPNGYYIPDGNGGWLFTKPNTFNKSLTEKNQACNSRLKPAIRLAKIWNADRSYPFSSYPMERQTVDFSYYGCEDNTMSHFLRIMDKLELPSSSAQWRIDRLARAREIIANTRYYLNAGNEVAAETEIKKLIPSA
jgi:predicted nucleotidyltransferase